MKYIFIAITILFSSLLSRAQNPTPKIDSATIKHMIDQLSAIIEANGPVLIDDDFSSNKNHWYIGDDSIGMTKVEDHVYKIKPGKNGNSIEVTKAINLKDSHDWKIEAEMMSTGNEDQKGYGICFGSSKSRTIYFEILTSGEAIWTKDGTTMDAKDVSQYMNKGSGEINKLTVQHVIRRDEWSFRLNDKEIFASKDYSFYGNRFGFITETPVNVSHFRIYDWSKSEGMPDSLIESDYSSSYFDSFHSGDEDWLLDNDEEISTTLIADAIRMELKKDVAHYLYRNVTVYGDDFRIDFLCSRLHSVDPSNSIGLIFGLKESGDRFYFCFNGNGQARVYELHNGDWLNLCDWISSKAINSTDGADNLLSVEEKKKRWYFRVNGTIVYSCSARQCDGTGYGWQIEGLTAIKVKSFNICQAHIPTIKYVNPEEEAPFDATKFAKQFVDLMCAVPNGFPDYVGEVNDRDGNGYIAYDSKLYLSGGDTYRIYEYEKSKAGKKFWGQWHYETLQEGEKAFDEIAGIIAGAQSPCFTLEKTDEKPTLPQYYPKYIMWRDPKTKELVELSLENWVAGSYQLRITIGKKEK